MRAGLADPKLRADVVGGGRDWAGYELVEQTVCSLLPGWHSHGIRGAEDIHPEGLAARLRDEIGDDGSLMLDPLFGAWTRLQP